MLPQYRSRAFSERWGTVTVSADFPPVGFGRNLKAVVFREEGIFPVAARFGKGGLGFFVEHVAEAFQEEQRKDELFVVAGIDGSPQECGRSPEVGFKLLLGDVPDHGLPDFSPGFVRFAPDFCPICA